MDLKENNDRTEYLNTLNEFKGIYSLSGYEETEKVKKELKAEKKKRKSRKSNDSQALEIKKEDVKIVECTEQCEITNESLLNSEGDKTDNNENLESGKLKKKNKKRKHDQLISSNETEATDKITQEVAKKKRKKDVNQNDNNENIETETTDNKDNVEVTSSTKTTLSNTENPKIIKKYYVLLKNINGSITSDEIKDYLSENDVDFNKVMFTHGSIGIAGFKREKEITKLFNVCQGVKYKNNDLNIFNTKINIPSENHITNCCGTSIHIKNLDPLIKLKDISTILEDLPVKNVSINTEKRTAVIDFEDENSANSAIALFDNKQIGENITQATFLVKSKRPDMFTIKVTNLPENVTKSDIRSTFTCAAKINHSNKTPTQCLITFKSEDDLNAVLNTEIGFSVKDNAVTIERLTYKDPSKTEVKNQYVLNVFNLPFDTTCEELKQNYENVRYVEMLKNDDGKFFGSAKLMFVEKEQCEEALKKSKGLIFKHRRVRAEMKIEESTR